MRALRKVIVLGLAGLGMYKAWELLSPKIQLARDKTAQARGQVEPAFRDARDTMQTASRDAAGSVVDASRDALETVTDAVEAVGDPPEADTRTTPAPATPG